MFSKIRELIMEPNYFLCVLIDEVESLAHARNAGSNDAEPADSMRVVNALLTQIDSIRRFVEKFKGKELRSLMLLLNKRACLVRQCSILESITMPKLRFSKSFRQHCLLTD